MKRLRDEGYAGSQFKRPFGASRGESYGLPQKHVGGGHRLTTDDALQYLTEVKELFQDQREKYDEFLEVMTDFKAKRIDTEGVISKVKELFKGHNNLIYGFNTFLPKSYEITIDDDEPPPRKVVEFEEAISFVNKIKKRFQNDDQVYKSFLEILNMYRKEHKTINEVYDEVSQLFEDQPDLLEEFTRFLPDNSGAAAIYHTQHARSTFPRPDERSSTPSSRKMHVDKLWHRGRVTTSHSTREISAQQPEMDDDRVPKVHKDQRRRDKDNLDRRNHDLDDREHMHNSNRDNMQRILDKKKPGRKVEGFRASPVVASSEDKKALKRKYRKEFMFCEKVKERLDNADDYQAFLKCLHIYSTKIITRSELQSFVSDLLGKYPDLMEAFNELLERCENIDGFLAGVMSKKSIWNDGHLSRSVTADEKDKAPKRELEPAKEKTNTDYDSKSIQELDLSNCERCTPSYRLLPDDYPISTASQRSDIGAQVLNDYWVSVTSGSEDYSFKHMRRNQYEESLFRCEDDRFELDMLLESVTSTIKRAEDLLNSINNNTISADGPIRVEDYMTPLNLRCVERLYGDHGLDARDILHKTPAIALPVILTRLKQKQEEWTKCRADFNKVWAEIYSKNHYKSLDHRSFYFKQKDSKNLSTKSLLAEIKEIKENMQKEDDMLLDIAAGNKRPLIPHFQYEYPNADIHEDLYKLIKYSCEEVCSTKEQLNKVMKLWISFLEPMLGLTSHSHGTNGVEDKKSQLMPSENGVGVGTERDGSHNANVGQPKLVPNGDESIHADTSKSSKPNGDTINKEEIFCELDAMCRVYSSSSVQPKTQHGSGGADRVQERLLSSTWPPHNDEERCHSRSTVEAGSGLQSTVSPPLNGDLKSNMDRMHSLSGAPNGSAATLANGAFEHSSKAKQYPERPSKVEKEEGELSPNGDTDEVNSVADGDPSTQAGPKERGSIGNKNYRETDGDATVVENDIDADVDGEKVSDGANDASGSESGGDECSRGDHEEEEEVEHDDLDGKADSEGEAEVHHSGSNRNALPSSQQFSVSVKPLTKYVSSVSQATKKKDSRVFYGNDSFYVLFRLHRALYERILAAITSSECPETKWRNTKEADPYASFMSALYNLLDGTSDNAKFEEDCQAIIGNQSYVLFTLDKLIYKLVKQLQAVATDEMDNKLVQLYEYEKSRRPGKVFDSVYCENTRVLLREGSIYRFEFSSFPACMSIQLTDNANEKPEMVAVTFEPNFAAYLFNEFLSVSSSRKEPQGILLQRNKRVYAGLDEHSTTLKAMEDVQLCNGLECKIACNSSKISYVLDTEDFFSRVRKRRIFPSDLRTSLDQTRVRRFHRFLVARKS